MNFRFQFFLSARDQELQPGGWLCGLGDGEGRESVWGGGDSVEERDSAMEFVSGGWEWEEVCNELGGGRSGRGRLDVGIRLKGEAMTGNGLGGV